MAEDTPFELKIVLGWLLNTQKFCIGLPTEKAIDWIASIDIVLERGHTLEKRVAHNSWATKLCGLYHFTSKIFLKQITILVTNI